MVTKISGSLPINNRLNEISNSQDKTISRLASGKRIVTSADDPAALSMSASLEAHFGGLSKEITNRQDEISLIQTAESGMSGVNDALQRIRELSVQAANGTLTDQDRRNIQFEVDQLTQQIDLTANQTEFNTKKLLDGSLEITLQNGSNFKIPGMGSAALGISTAMVTTQEQASLSIGVIDNAMGRVNSERGSLGAVTNRLVSEIDAKTEEFINTVGANSRIADADMALEMLNLTKLQIQNQAGTQVFRIEDNMRGQILKLLGG